MGKQEETHGGTRISRKRERRSMEEGLLVPSTPNYTSFTIKRVMDDERGPAWHHKR